jgi:uncharacterized protein YfeS
MSEQKHDLAREHGKAGIKPAAPNANAQEAALRQYHRERLARLFRHIGDNADDRYLLDLMTHYRGLEAS